MIQVINQPVSVISKYDHQTLRTVPVRFKWRQRLYEVNKLGYYHQYKEGTRRFHIFEGTTSAFFFRLKLEAENLQWTLEKIADAEVG